MSKRPDVGIHLSYDQLSIRASVLNGNLRIATARCTYSLEKVYGLRGYRGASFIKSDQASMLN